MLKDEHLKEQTIANVVFHISLQNIHHHTLKRLSPVGVLYLPVELKHVHAIYLGLWHM